MKKYWLVVVLMMPMLAGAAERIGIIDPIAALQASEEFQKRYGELEASVEEEQRRLETLGKEVEALRARLEKEGMTMSESDREELQNQGQQKMAEVQNLRQAAQRKMNQGQQALLEVMEPKLKQAVDTVSERENLDLVVNAQAVVYLKSEMDLTDQVTKELNANN